MTQKIPLQKLLENKGQIKGLPKNPRFIRDEKFNQLKKSLQDDPEMLELRELIVFKVETKYVIVCGNMRYRAAKELGFIELPCKILQPDFPEEKMRAIATKDNVSFGAWDMELLSSDWINDEIIDWGVELLSDLNSVDVSKFFEDTEEKEKTSKMITCPHCGKEHSL